ncbi:C40 family peptidase [Actinacidiphila sp. ITFR-21]|uniref:C40 family peptidase n=1 Tax=Actinacidiphila sp. ITFR-21 TaxID=3075199 RepID=UPI00288AE2FF|nr:C40 family peptidase [Streptomyces sp. ITFR-21]WNI17175.1 C40 family peptidase [Streptomyces sp. ITFR-21]
MADNTRPDRTTDTGTFAAVTIADSARQAAAAFEQDAIDASLAAAREQAVADAAKDATRAKRFAEARAAAAAKKAKAARERAAAARAAARPRLATTAAATPIASSAAPTATASTASAAPASSGKVDQLIAFLKSQLGKPYVYGATGPGSYDCSGLTQAAFASIGVDLPRTSQEQSTAGTPVSVSALQPGDLIFWGGEGSAYHVGVFIGDGQYLDAANPSTPVAIHQLADYMPDWAVSVL